MSSPPPTSSASGRFSNGSAGPSARAARLGRYCERSRPSRGAAAGDCRGLSDERHGTEWKPIGLARFTFIGGALIVLLACPSREGLKPARTLKPPFRPRAPSEREARSYDGVPTIRGRRPEKRGALLILRGVDGGFRRRVPAAKIHPGRHMGLP